MNEFLNRFENKKDSSLLELQNHELESLSTKLNGMFISGTIEEEEIKPHSLLQIEADTESGGLLTLVPAETTALSLPPVQVFHSVFYFFYLHRNINCFSLIVRRLFRKRI